MSRIPNIAGRAKGVAMMPGSAIGKPLAKPELKDPSSVFTPLFPTYRIRHAYFNWCEVPAALNVGSGNAFLFGLGRIQSPGDIGQEFTLFGANFSLLPCNVNGVDYKGFFGGASTVPWGDRDGTGAAIIIGRNLPMTKGAWTAANVYAPGIGFASIQENSGMEETTAEYFAVQSFPTGALVAPADTTTVLNKINPGRQFAPYASRITAGQTLDVALAVDPVFVEELASLSYLSGFAHVQLMIGNTDFANAFTE